MIENTQHSPSGKTVRWGRKCLSTLFAVSAMATAISTAQAQSKNSLALEEVVVSAQKREQNALDVPITVDTFSPSDIRNTGALSVMDIDAYIPGFDSGDTNVTQNGLTIRGVSSSNISSGGDPSVAVFYDDVYLPLPASNITYLDLAQIEVLKGPQGTLFGRNAAAGVVNLVPNQPGEEEEAYISTRFGTDNLIRVEGMVNTQLADDVYLRVSAIHNEKDGFIENVGTGRDPGEEDNQAARIAVLWNITDDTRVQLSYDWDKVNNASRMAAGISRFSLTQDPTSSKLANDTVNAEETRDMDAWTFKLFHDFDDQLSMKWVSSYRQWDTTNIEEEDGTAEPTVYVDVNTSYDSDILYNELQFLFTTDRYTVTTGASYSKEDVSQFITTTTLGDSISRLATQGVNAEFGTDMDHYWNADELSGALNDIGFGIICGGICTPEYIESTGDDIYEIISAVAGDRTIFGPSYAGVPWRESVINTGDFTNWGVYADVDFTLTDKWSVLAGLRYSQDDKDYTWLTPTVDFPREGVTNQIFNADSNLPIIDQLVKGSDDWNKTTGRLVLNYQISETAMTFLTYSTGYKSGGFDSLDQRTAIMPFGPEEVTNYEWGIKGDFLDNQVRTQLSVYRMEVEDRQRSVDSKAPDQPFAVPKIISGDQTFDGVEVTVDWLIAEDLKFGVVTAYHDEDSEFDDYYDANGDFITERENKSSDFKYTLVMDWTPTTPIGELLIHVDYIFEEVSEEDEPNYLPEYESIDGFNEDKKFLNARIAWFSDDQHYEAALWGKNLLDNQYVSLPGGLSKDSFGTIHARTNQPLSWGVDLRYNF